MWREKVRELLLNEIQLVSGGFLLEAAQAEIVSLLVAGYLEADLKHIAPALYGMAALNTVLIASYLFTNQIEFDLAMMIIGASVWSQAYIGVYVAAFLYIYGKSVKQGNLFLSA